MTHFFKSLDVSLSNFDNICPLTDVTTGLSVAQPYVASVLRVTFEVQSDSRTF